MAKLSIRNALLCMCMLFDVLSAQIQETDWGSGIGLAGEEYYYSLSEVVIDQHGGLGKLHNLGRRQVSATPLKNNVPANKDINAGETQYWQFPASELSSPLFSGLPLVPSPQSQQNGTKSDSQVHQELKRQTGNKIYVTLNVCNQPSAGGQTPSGPPPSPSLYISYSNSNQNPGPGYQGSQQTAPIPANGGRAFYEESQSGDTYIGVSAPQLQGFSGHWTYQIAASNQDYYTGYFDYVSLGTVDTDAASGLFITEGLADPLQNNSNLITQWENTGGPFGIFIYDATDPMMGGINRSFCGLSTYALAKGQLQGMSTAGSEAGIQVFNNTLPYQQFYVGGLNKSSNYKAALALPGNYSLKPNSLTPTGGGSIWRSIDFKTRSGDTNCQLIYNLTFCEDIAYAVPTNASYYTNTPSLASLYDNYTSQTLWPNFRNSLDQVPCNTSADAKYSLARNCDDCAAAYKEWVCAVSIPRCADVSSTAPSLKLRNTQGFGNFRNGTDPSTINNPNLVNPMNIQSRNMNLTSFVPNTGPYNEVLPCDSLCHNLVQSCPSILGFACPWPGRGLEWSYATLKRGQGIPVTDGYPTCNLPGSIWGISGSSKITPPKLVVACVLGVIILLGV